MKGYLAKFAARTVSKHCVHKAEKCFRRTDPVRRLSRGLDDGPGEKSEEALPTLAVDSATDAVAAKNGAEEPTLAA